jgi:hypothetical protein
MKGVNLFIKRCLITVLLIFTANLLFAPPPPPPTGGHGQSGDLPAGGGAPLGDGYFLLAALAAGYLVRKLQKLEKMEAQ